MMGYLLQISQANNMIEKFIIGKKICGDHGKKKDNP